MEETYHKWYSQFLKRDLEMLVFGEFGEPVILFPHKKGRFYDCKDNGMISALEDLIVSRKIKVYCPDTIDEDSWYNFEAHPSERVKKHLLYESTIIKDVIEFTKYDTGKDRVILGGVDLGGYHALNLSLKHPELVSAMISVNGFYDIKQFIMGYYDEDCYFNNPFDYLPNLTDRKYLDPIEKIKFIFGVIEGDLSMRENLEISSIFKLKKIGHRLDIRNDVPNGWDGWNKLMNEYLKQLFD
ncbi:putative esterase [Melioribacter roseus P3M-2]|uniref:Putative esterase n=1 Tax=Melioribacter roseus (strain DSM 23840 / JCM 17771 / VKM B-2668 / P3M-2) TaxID=1191523 RepID=I6ZUA3_MELRP|nr:esterase family protein [Melioribacter roseus]AFN75589.1 putative esterase [Melioribacter roseus P3M-2]